jgi:hypothetical protein
MNEKLDQEKKELTKEERLELENQAIETLLQYGAKFSVPLKIFPRTAPKLIQWWNKHFPKLAIRWTDKRVPKKWLVEKEDVSDLMTGTTTELYMRRFHIRPLYLGTIDMIRSLELEIEFNEDAIQKNPSQESEKLFKYNKLMAKIVAVATLNISDVADPLNNEVKDLAKFFYTHLTSARLQRLCMIIDQLKNRGGFTNSIRLILQVPATTIPKADRVE